MAILTYIMQIVAGLAVVDTKVGYKSQDILDAIGDRRFVAGFAQLCADLASSSFNQNSFGEWVVKDDRGPEVTLLYSTSFGEVANQDLAPVAYAEIKDLPADGACPHSRRLTDAAGGLFVLPDVYTTWDYAGKGHQLLGSHALSTMKPGTSQKLAANVFFSGRENALTIVRALCICGDGPRPHSGQSLEDFFNMTQER